MAPRPLPAGHELPSQGFFAIHRQDRLLHAGSLGEPASSRNYCRPVGEARLGKIGRLSVSIRTAAEERPCRGRPLGRSSTPNRKSCLEVPAPSVRIRPVVPAPGAASTARKRDQTSHTGQRNDAD